MCFKPFTKIARTLEDIKNSTYTIFNNQLGIKATINSFSLKLILECVNPMGEINRIYFLIPKYKLFFRQLEKLGFLEKDYSEGPRFLCDYQDITTLPLTSLNIELTHRCNFKCLHCYGSFGGNEDNAYISLKQVEKLIPELNKLGTINISLTGGECLLNPDFEKIAILLLNNGFNLWILSNGYLTDKLIAFTSKVKEFKFAVKISLDGNENHQTIIRGMPDAYERVIKTLDYLNAQNNITLYISSTLMRINFNEYESLRGFIQLRFPNATHTVNLVFPDGNSLQSKQAFSLSELNDIKSIHPELFKVKSDKQNVHRCSGGINQCTLSPDGSLKICNAACDKRFKFIHNVFETSLIYAWVNCGKLITFYRNELNYSSPECINCKNKKSCFANNCRIMALLYKGDETKCSPLTCMSAELAE